MKSLNGLRFLETLIIILIAWVLVSLWVRFIENLAYKSLRLNINSAFHTFVVAAVITAIFVTFIYFCESPLGSIIIGSEGSSIDNFQQEQDTNTLPDPNEQLAIASEYKIEDNSKKVLPPSLFDTKINPDQNNGKFGVSARRNYVPSTRDKTGRIVSTFKLSPGRSSGYAISSNFTC